MDGARVGGGRRSGFARTARSIPGFGRVADVLALAGASSQESRLGALVLCAAATLAPADVTTDAFTMRPLALAHRLGARDAEIRGALAWLLRANLLGAVDRAEGTDPEVRVLANWAGVAAPPVASVVDWGTIIERLAGQPAALSVALAFAESTVAPGEQTPVTVPQLVVSARYSDRTVKGALARLVEEGVLVRGPRIGARSRYAFSEAALGLASFPDAVDPPETREATSGTSDVDAALSDLRAELQTLRSLVQTASPIGGSHPMARTPHGEPATGATTPVYLEIQGIRVALPPGATLNLEPDATGQLWYRIGNSRLGPIAP